SPWLTPQFSVPRCLTVSSVPAVATAGPSPTASRARASQRRRPVMRAGCVMRLSPRVDGSERGGMADDDLAADRHAGIEVDHIAIGEAEAAGGDGMADGFRLVRPVDAIDGGAEIERPRSHGIAGSARHEPRQ